MYYDEDAKWKCFEESGSIADYLEYKGVLSTVNSAEGDCESGNENT